MNTTLSYAIAGICVLVFLLFKEWRNRFLILSVLIVSAIIVILMARNYGVALYF